jgi:hypothetical protein
MKFYEAKIKTLSPTIIPERRFERGYKGQLSYIPSTTLRGAILSSLYTKGYLSLDEIKAIGESYELLVSNAYLIDNEFKSYPSHPFMYKCKIPHGTDDKGNKIFESKIFISEDEVANSLKSGIDPIFKFECSKGHVAIEHPHPKPVRKANRSEEEFREVSIKVQSMISVGISKHRASSQAGMLYEYDAMIEGQEFWCYIGVLRDEICKYIKSGLEIKIGRGISRGFGRSVMEKIEEISLDKIIEELKSSNIAVEGKNIIFYSLSPLLKIDDYENYKSYPDILDLKFLMNICGLNEEAGILEIKRVYGKERNLHCGWDICENTKRPIFYDIASEGSIAIGSISGKNIPLSLALLSLIGYPIKTFNKYVVTGINMLTPIQINSFLWGKNNE